MQHPTSRFAEILKSVPSLLGLSTDEPRREVVTVFDEGVEIRRYAPVVLAQINVAGDAMDALQRGCDRIDRYLDGLNETGVAVERTSELRRFGSVEGWSVARVLTAANVEELPLPRGRELRLVRLPEQSVAALTYRGEHEEDRERATATLVTALAAHPDYRVVSDAQWATVGPVALPFLQRKEVRVQLDPASVGLGLLDTQDTWSLAWLATGLPWGP